MTRLDGSAPQRAQVTAVDCDGASLAQLRQREDKVKIVQMDLEEALAC